jgi:peptidoglycan/LPS O-acetylase OafA/YrhL
METKGRISSLDGTRAVSIALVIIGHANWNRTYPVIWRFHYWDLGVRIFFVISGFLITKLLLDERAKTGRISIPQFYLRRAFRILPASYVYIAVLAALVPLGMHLAYKDVPSVLLYYANYHSHATRSPLGQFWSLAVEEQFYFLWPAALVLLGTRRATAACGALLITAPALRVLSDLGLWPRPPGDFLVVCDALATGCLLALLRGELWSARFYRAMVESRALWVLAAFAILLTCKGIPAPLIGAIGVPLLNASIAMLLDRYMRMPGTRIGRTLNWRPIAWVGAISYSLYIWQQAWMFSTLPLIVRFAGAFSCAALSFYLVEKPMLRLRARISKGPKRSARLTQAMP